MKQATLIQCTQSKYDTTSKAKNLYEKSPFFRAMRRWAVARDHPWFIISAKYGLLNPDAEIEPYDERGLDAMQVARIADELSDGGFKTIHISAGRDYTTELIPELERRGIDVVNHFAGCRIGERIRRLRIAASELENESL